MRRQKEAGCRGRYRCPRHMLFLATVEMGTFIWKANRSPPLRLRTPGYHRSSGSGGTFAHVEWILLESPCAFWFLGLRKDI